MAILCLAIFANLLSLVSIATGGEIESFLPALLPPQHVSKEGENEDLEALAFKRGNEWLSVAEEWDCELAQEQKWCKLCTQWATMADKVNVYLAYVEFKQANRRQNEDTEELKHLAVKPYIAKSSDGSKNAQRNVERELNKNEQEAQHVPHFGKRWSYVPLSKAMKQIVHAHKMMFDGAKNATKAWRRTIHAQLKKLPVLVLVNKISIVEFEELVDMFRRGEVQSESDSAELSDQGRAERERIFALNLRFIKGIVDSAQGYMLWFTPQKAFIGHYGQMEVDAFKRFGEAMGALTAELRALREMVQASDDFNKSQEEYIEKIASEENNQH